MSTQKMYSSKESFEAKNPYVCVETPSYQGKKCAPAQIVGDYSSKKVAENQSQGGQIMTRKAAEKYITRWNTEFEAGNYACNF
jgi:hypothetical protein